MPKMTQAQALKEARAKWGDEAFVRYDRRECWKGDPLPHSDEERAAYRAEFMRLKDDEPTFMKLADWPADTPLYVYRDALAKYTAEKLAWRERKDACQSLSYYHRYSVGTRRSIFSETKGHGDSWEQALAKAGKHS